jgi:hypothetical protein
VFRWPMRETALEPDQREQAVRLEAVGIVDMDDLVGGRRRRVDAGADPGHEQELDDPSLLRPQGKGVAVHHHDLVQMGRGDAKSRLLPPLHDERALGEEGRDIQARGLEPKPRRGRPLLQGGVAGPVDGGHVGARNRSEIVDLLEGHLIERIFVGLDGGCQRPP